MRHLRVRSSGTVTRGTQAAQLYAPLRDLSAVDVSVPAAVRPRDRLNDGRGFLRHAWLRRPWLSTQRYTGFLRSAWLGGAWLRETATVICTAPERVEAGVAPVAVTDADAYGNESAQTASTALVLSSPQPQAAASIDRSSGIRMTIEDWHHG